MKSTEDTEGYLDTTSTTLGSNVFDAQSAGLSSEQADKNALSRQIVRAGRAAKLIGSLGVKNGTRMVAQRLLKPEQASTLLHTINTDKLIHPFTLSSAHGDLAMFYEVIAEDLYSLESLRSLIDGRLIVDAGANIGVSSAYFATNFQNSPILAIEPHPRNLTLLLQNATRYGDRIDVLEGAFSDGLGVIGLANPYEEASGNHGSYLFSSRTESQGVPEAKAITPADILARLSFGARVGLLKVNIEGAEKEVFDSPDIDRLLQKTNVLVVQTHDFRVPEASKTVTEAASRNGFVLVDQKGTMLFYVNPIENS